MELYPEPIDLANARAECLISKGWASEVEPENASIATLVPPGMEQDFAQDDADCLEAVGLDVGRDLTVDEFSTLYDQYTDLANCLEGLGYPASAIPSEQSFTDSYFVDPWVPWLVVPDEFLSDAIESCPLPPPVY